MNCGCITLEQSNKNKKTKKQKNKKTKTKKQKNKKKAPLRENFVLPQLQESEAL